MNITIREYQDTDETGWVRCRVISFLDTSYYDDIKREKEKYDHSAICLVAEHDNQIVGFIDIEYEQKIGEVCYLKGSLGANIWNLGVLPEFRNKHIAQMLWEQAKKILIDHGIQRVELWTQDDYPANSWYKKQGFQQIESYLNIWIEGDLKDRMKSYINYKHIGKIYGIRCLNFEAPIERKQEFIDLFNYTKQIYRIHEVRLYEIKL